MWWCRDRRFASALPSAEARAYHCALPAQNGRLSVATSAMRAGMEASRLTGLAGSDDDDAISFGLPFEPEDSQYGEYRDKGNAMQPSTWNDTNQHWIPQFLLKGFGIRGHSSKIYELDRESGNIEVRRVTDVASKQRLLTERDDELMKSIEQRTKDVIGIIRKGNLNLKEERRRAVDKLVFALMHNDPYSGFDEETTRKKIVDSMSKMAVEAFRQQGGVVNPQDIRDYTNDLWSHDYLSTMMEMEESMVLDVLRLMGLRAHRPMDGESFLIGDSPLLVVRGTADGVTDLRNPGSQIILPVQSRCVLVYSWETPFNLIQSGQVLNQQQVRSLNQDYYRESNSRYIYGRNRDSLESVRTLKMRRTPELRSTRVNDGWQRMQVRSQEMSRARATRDAEQKRLLNSFVHDLVRKAEVNAQG